MPSLQCCVAGHMAHTATTQSGDAVTGAKLEARNKQQQQLVSCYCSTPPTHPPTCVRPAVSPLLCTGP